MPVTKADVVRIIKRDGGPDVGELLALVGTKPGLWDGLDEEDVMVVLRAQLEKEGISAGSPEDSLASLSFSPAAGARLENAPQLEKQTASLSLLLDSQGNRQVVAGLPLFLEDEGGCLVSALQGWLDALDGQMGATGDSLLPPLLISGLIKTGKSFALSKVLPAVARGHKRFGIGGDQELLICFLDFEQIAGGKTYVAALRALFQTLVGWAVGGRARLPISLLASLNGLSAEDLEGHILGFLETLPPTLLCGDELHAWFLLVDEQNGSRAWNFLKTIMCKTTSNILFTGTESMMASVWANVAAMAPNGISMLTHTHRVHLPAVVSTAAAKESWQFLQHERADVPDKLADYSSRSVPAMQVYLCQGYLNSAPPRPSTPAELLLFVREFEIMKLQLEASRDFVPILKKLSNAERLVLLHLVSDDGIILGQLRNPLALLLGPFLTSSQGVGGNTVIRLSAPWHAPLIQRLIGEDGTLKDYSLIELTMWLPLAYTSACVALTGFGEEVNKAMKANPSGADIDATFKVMAADKACASSTWWQAPWAAAILSSPNCSAAARKFHSMVQQGAATTHLLAQLHVCLRHIEAHKGFSVDTKQLVDAYPFAEVGSIAQFLRKTAERSPILNTLSTLSAASASATASAPSSASNPSTPTNPSSSSSSSSPRVPSSPSGSSSGMPGLKKPRRTAFSSPGASTGAHPVTASKPPSGSRTSSSSACMHGILPAAGGGSKRAVVSHICGQSKPSAPLYLQRHAISAKHPVRQDLQRARPLGLPAVGASAICRLY